MHQRLSNNQQHKAFIPYTGVFAESPNREQHAIIQAKVSSMKEKEITLDREWQGSKQIPFDYLVAATGTRLAARKLFSYL